MKAMILAAGRGQRMQPLTDDCPKALLRLGDKPLIQFHIEALLRAGIREIVINLAWLGEQIRDYLGDGSQFGASIVYSDEGSRALETGGGIRKALGLLGDQPFWLVNGDVFTDFDYKPQTIEDDMLAHLLMVQNPEHNPEGDFGLREGLVQVSAENRYTYTGIAIIRPELLANTTAGVFPLAPLLQAAANNSAVSGELFNGLWIDVGTPERLQSLREFLQG
jgi:MurNAc alpha-1-phosphate uridylyltransferase